MVVTVQDEQQRILTFSEALEKTSLGKFNYFLILIGGLVFCNGLLETASLGFILPNAECDLYLTNEDKGMLNAIGFVGIIVSSHLWGFLADTRGRRTVIMPTLLTSFVVTLLSSFSHRFWVLLVLRFINGFLVSGSLAATFAYVSEFHSDKTRSRAIMGSSFIFSVGALLLPFVAWGIINQKWSVAMPFLDITYKPWRIFVVVSGTPGVLSGLGLIFYPESPKFLLSVGKDKEAIEILKKMHKWNVGPGKELEIDGIIPECDTKVRNLNKDSAKSAGFAATLLRAMWQQTVPILQDHFLRPTLIICIIQFWLSVVIHGLFAWFPYITDSVAEYEKHNSGNETFICEVIYAEIARGIDNQDETSHCAAKLDVSSYIYTIVLEIICTVGYLVIIVIINKVRRVHILFVILVSCGACGVACVHVHNSSVALILCSHLFFSGVGIQVLSGATAELYPTHLRGMMLCISMMCGRLGGVVGSNIVGFMLTKNCEMPFHISGISLILCGFLAFFLPKQLICKECDRIEAVGL